jgi:regulatory protein
LFRLVRDGYVSKSRATVAQSWQMSSNRSSNRQPKIRKPLDAGGLDRLALHYVGRYATTRAKLAAYLRRKVRERGWAGEAAPDFDVIVGRCAELGYVDDRAFAETRSASLSRRGYGERRIGAALKNAGIAAEIVVDVMPDEEAALAAAESYARRKRIGIYGPTVTDPKQRQKQFASMIRAGHSFDLAKRLLNAVASDLESEIS